MKRCTTEARRHKGTQRKDENIKKLCEPWRLRASRARSLGIVVDIFDNTNLNKRNLMMKKIAIALILSLAVTTQVLAEKDQLTLSRCQTIAEENYSPLKLAKEEIGVRDAKAAEAARALWPNLSAKGEFTDGASIVELGTPGFREASYGLQLSQTLFSGGKLWSTYKQAQLNKKIAEEKYRKAKLDMNYQLQEAYWNLVRVNQNYKQYAETLKDSSRYLKMAKKLFADGTINKRHLIATETRKNSNMYQKQSTQAEMEKFRWNLAAALGVDKPTAWELVKGTPYYESTVTLEECLQKAEEHNPDYLVQQLSLKAGEYEKKIHYSQDWPKIELNGFYGRSGGAYNSEDMELDEDYNISIKLTQKFAWNSLALSGFDQKTSPKLGQSSRTESRTASATLGILDGYKSAAEKKEAGWQFQQAQYNQKKARQTLMVEVREAFYNVHKGKAQVEHAKLEVELAKSELAIQKIHLRDEKVGISDVAEANNKLANSLAALTEAKVYYLLALAALDKAVGIEGYSIQNKISTTIPKLRAQEAQSTQRNTKERI